MIRTAVLLLTITALAACAVGPDYRRPDAPTPAAFKELAGWTPGHPADGLDAGAWWAIYQDPSLDALERQVEIGNQNLKYYEAAYRQARAVVAESRAGLFPTLSAAPSVSRAKSGRSSATSYTGELEASWDVDLWGKIRRKLESSQASAEASAAELADARLSAQAELATDYITLRGQDDLIDLLTTTVVAYERSLAITRNQYDAGVASRSDVVTAQAQLEATRSSLVAAGETRATNEHAIALLVGKAPAELSIPAGHLPAAVPVPPVSLPSTLLQRRPDIAETERTVAAQNALIGVEMAAYYPSISLSAAAGYTGSPLSSLISASHQVWNIAASGSETLFDGGLRAADVEAARAAYDQAVALYRQTVLTAFQGVEDELSTLRILQDQAVVQERTVQLATEATQIALNEYRAGTVSYTTVVTAQATELSDRQTLITIQQERLAASIALVKALGGGWAAPAGGACSGAAMCR